MVASLEILSGGQTFFNFFEFEQNFGKLWSRMTLLKKFKVKFFDMLIFL